MNKMIKILLALIVVGLSTFCFLLYVEKIKRSIYVDAVLRKDSVYLKALMVFRGEGISDEEKSRIADIYLETALDHAIGLDPADVSREQISSFYDSVFNFGEEEILSRFVKLILSDPRKYGFSKSGLENKFGSKIEIFFADDTKTTARLDSEISNEKDTENTSRLDN